ncbi:antibiotic biosynthesis monooxygenase family protein [Gimesia aquarii]|uniref:Antibiotic biosynthesis monooxygenase n=1 Tax=Gimesia aquarii TaxID=2527964 RepID=A0A517VSB6_9PLAN|nr:antibiotic biosynthesis monooxygenase family protein [Gimesia aquarii]QDT95905.1 Antibiotic biosynthesis monooxygenase [Gimesia aquarii]
MSVTLLNPFEVPEGKEAEAIEYWERGADVMRKSPGFISTRLHRAISSDARFHLINMAEWESPAHFVAAIESDEFKEAIAEGRETFPHFPGLYEVVRT